MQFSCIFSCGTAAVMSGKGLSARSRGLARGGGYSRPSMLLCGTAAAVRIPPSGGVVQQSSPSCCCVAGSFRFVHKGGLVHLFRRRFCMALATLFCAEESCGIHGGYIARRRQHLGGGEASETFAYLAMTHEGTIAMRACNQRPERG